MDKGHSEVVLHAGVAIDMVDAVIAFAYILLTVPDQSVLG